MEPGDKPAAEIGQGMADGSAALTAPREITALEEMTEPTLDVPGEVTVKSAVNVEARAQHHDESIESPVVQETTAFPLDGKDGVAGELVDESKDGAEREQIQGADEDHKNPKEVINGSSNKSAYILFLGKEGQSYAECVEKVVTAKKCLIRLGYTVVGAFTSTQVTTKSNPKNGMSSVDKYTEMLKDSEHHDRRWIRMAPRN